MQNEWFAHHGIRLVTETRIPSFINILNFNWKCNLGANRITILIWPMTFMFIKKKTSLCREAKTIFYLKCLYVVLNYKNTVVALPVIAILVIIADISTVSLLAIYSHSIKSPQNIWMYFFYSQSNTSFQYHSYFFKEELSGTMHKKCRIVLKCRFPRTKSARWIQYSRMWTKGMKMWLIPPKNPWVECVCEPRCVGSVYYQPFSTALKHARTEPLHFHFSLGWAVTREHQPPPFPKCDPLCFTSRIKTFQCSLDGVLSPCKKAPPMGRHPLPK